jgi:hypothetical protein
MPEKECWTTIGRKKIYLVDEENNIIKEIDDLGPLSEKEMEWVKSGCGVPYKEWLELKKKEEEEAAKEEEKEASSGEEDREDK